MKPRGSMLKYQGSLIIAILSQINPISHTDIDLFKIHSNKILPSSSLGHPGSLLPAGLPVSILNELLSSILEIILMLKTVT